MTFVTGVTAIAGESPNSYFSMYVRWKRLVDALRIERWKVDETTWFL
jgi:hypothetical protein